MESSFVRYGRPAVLLSDGIVTVPLWAVTSISLGQTYHLPSIDDSGCRTVLPDHDDRLSLSGLLVGPERELWRAALQRLADVASRGGALAGVTGGRVAGLILHSALAVRTDLWIESLTFAESANRPEVTEVTIALVHVPLIGALNAATDLVAAGLPALLDWERL